ncbi:hypothetical protein K1719_018936 [Acacia pycnantha]|nr:hypothetical protein K1719_018936 [Acacia pycnantha]
MGRQPAYGFMLKKLRLFWERKGKIDIFDLENDFYLVNFHHSDDYMGALIGGPWVIADAYLSISHWKPEFNPRNEKIESLIAWVRFLELPAPLFDKKFLLNLGNTIGKAICLDVHTAQRSRDKFAHMCIELDITTPLIPSFSVGGNKLNVVYESLNSLCTNCGWYGHCNDVCERFHKSKVEEGMEVDEGETKEVWRTVQQEVGGVNGDHMDVKLGSDKGVASKSFVAVLRDSKHRYKVDMVVILEPQEQFIHCRLKLGPKEMLFTAVYASPCEQWHHQTWIWLHSLAGEINEPWLVAGDFNEIKTPLEQKGGMKVRVIPRVGSDHHPLLIKMVVDHPRAGFCNFRYEVAWQMHGEFEEFLQNS